MLYNQVQNVGPLSTVAHVQPQRAKRKWDEAGVIDKWPCTAGVWVKWGGTRAIETMGFLFSQALTAATGRRSLSVTHRS